MRVLVADDDASVRRLLVGVLENLGHEVLEASDGEEAWRALSAPDAPSVAVLDRQMPGLDGLEICRRVRAREGSAYVYVVLLSAAAEASDVAAGLAAGADDYVTKPFHAAELAARFRFAERTLHLHRKLEARVRELESLARRYDLLVDVLAKEPTACAQGSAPAVSTPTRPPPRPSPGPSPSPLRPSPKAILEEVPARAAGSEQGAIPPAPPSETGAGAPPTRQIAPERAAARRPGARPRGGKPTSPLERIPGGAKLAAAFRTCLIRLGFCPVAVEEPGTSTDGLALDYCVWFPIVLREPWRSLDFVLTASQTAAADLARALTGRSPESRQQIIEALEESANLLRTLARTSLESEASGCVAPVRPRGGLLPANFSKALGPGDRIVLRARAGEVDLALLISASRPKVRRKTARALSVGEVLVEPLTSPRNPSLVLLNTETALTDQYLEKIQDLAADEANPPAVAVLEPSPLGREMLAR